MAQPSRVTVTFSEPNKGEVIIEGKTKVVHAIVGDPAHVLVLNKDRITAGDGAKAHDLEGKAAISNATNAKVFSFLQLAGIKTSFVQLCGETSYKSRRCHMIPLEWVTRRVATGSFLRRHTGVNEGYRFTPPKMETFYKDDENHDPQWSEEQILETRLTVGGVVIGRNEYDIMAKTTVTVFEILERAWAALDCALIDMKIEFGIDSETKEILVSDTIDSDSWRLWPSGDKRLMKDKQVYRNLEKVTEEGLNQVKRNFQWVADKLDSFIPTPRGLVVVLMGSPSDAAHCEKIRDHCRKLGVACELRVTSAHKGTEETLAIIARYEGMAIPIVFIAVAGRSNGLGPVTCANTSYPVINCPPLRPEEASRDIWSSLSLPSGMGCGTVLYPEAAAQSAASILALSDHVIWSKIRAKQLNLWISLKMADQKMCETN
ncbi:bifunctional phosphoribosylaminoimidazole carboxylase/phosphoribosylaminoimidazole succinocarboxamide synthetase [Macrobrachium rosenbergii]|uniref:bifunctional phosphoribosylaminoimidazole carboxylase/phosphoribosylaminoimidazole succinocarboxamide synthetase n=1 Tax=Macrobrachium rosenbergii TaxID=79674 RepID=UPI0034D65E13